MSGEEEEDYMSEKFLSSLTDVRPSLIRNRAKKRELDIIHNQIENTKRQKEDKRNRSGIIDNEKLQKALEKPLEADNKGFKLLTKMGYKPGQAIGKESTLLHNDNEKNSLVEPIKIVIKSDRGGLGRDAAIRELTDKRRQIRQQHLHKKLKIGDEAAEDFRRRAMLKAEERFLVGALKRCQMSCESLDLKNDISTPEEEWFWPDRTTEHEDKDEEIPGVKETECDNEPEEEFTTAEKVELLSNYLRTSYNFCCWCGVHYENVTDLEQNCPGRSRDEH